MTGVTRGILAVTAIAACGIACGFVAAYFVIEYNNAIRNDAALPSLTRFVAVLAPWGFVVPLSLAIVAWVGRRSDFAAVVACCFAALFSLAWPLLCILAWRLPYELIGLALD